MHLIDNPAGNYRFLTGIAPYSSGVIAMPGYEIVHVTLHTPIPYRQGFALIDQQLTAEGRPQQALCAMELRSPTPFTFAGFAEFNAGYQAILAEWGLLRDEGNPIARTNIAPEVAPPTEPSLYGFSYTIPTTSTLPPTFVIAGAGDLQGGVLAPEAIVRQNETTADAIREKAAHVMGIMTKRLLGLQAEWSQLTAVDVYTIHPLQPFVATEILEKLGSGATHGLRWFYSRPPIIGLEFEMDMRGIRREIRLE
ncbi:MAG: RidA family protein [Chloroflexota bacterium]